MGLLSVIDPVDPKNALLKEKMPPSEATSQNPPQSGVGAIPTTGLLRLMEPVEPRKLASRGAGRRH